MLAILLLAAGRSARMYTRDKLLEPVDNAPLLKTLTNRAATTGAPVFVVLPPDRPKRNAALSGTVAQIVIADDAHLGMAHSLRAGIAALPANVSAAMVLPADMPEITAMDFAEMHAAHSAPGAGSIQRATTADGTPGHPVIFPRALFPDLVTLAGDQGARAILMKHSESVGLVPLPDRHAVIDLDTPDDWDNWRKSRL
ncbi:Molybdenum cofactor guanylyltransferase [Shimia sp. SK013]|uniref:nucleotidyltransferase family protein n=1 Tax=Shimia sp. SK013 TaxID=1389006 RepID=UPI0006B4EE0D|nr:nucleotidyltransferase family protein [Shimia sp. SK013]KPA22393.1 Molybdenum cofactor guanylyltransferase [Shimia sp. SK013]